MVLGCYYKIVIYHWNFAKNFLLQLTENTDRIHPDFRLMDNNMEVHPKFPIGLLQISIKYTAEPPQGTAVLKGQR